MWYVVVAAASQITFDCSEEESSLHPTWDRFPTVPVHTDSVVS
jgi:hypothetical protein